MKYITKNTLDQKIRTESVSLLQDGLSNSIDVLFQAKQAHWNVKGENFASLHQLFDQTHEFAEEWVDLLAERIMQLGGVAIGTLRETAGRTSLPEYPLNISDGMHHVEALSEAIAFFGELVRTSSEKADRLGDRNSADILTQISREADKQLWMLESHGQAGKIIKTHQNVA